MVFIEVWITASHFFVQAIKPGFYSCKSLVVIIAVIAVVAVLDVVVLVVAIGIIKGCHNSFHYSKHQHVLHL
jgi:hypothetical protein